MVEGFKVRIQRTDSARMRDKGDPGTEKWLIFTGYRLWVTSPRLEDMRKPGWLAGQANVHFVPAVGTSKNICWRPKGWLAGWAGVGANVYFVPAVSTSNNICCMPKGWLAGWAGVAANVYFVPGGPQNSI